MKNRMASTKTWVAINLTIVFVLLLAMRLYA
jgi:hypothetical protein